MFLMEENYFSPEANWEYMSVSQYKDFAGSRETTGCEAMAMAKLRGDWAQEVSIPMLVGSYVDAHFEGTLNIFKAQNPEIFRKKDNKEKAPYQKADEIICRIERDELFMRVMSGEKQVILTGELFGTKWKGKLDSYLKGSMIVDLKVVKDLYERIYVKDGGYFVSFVEYWGYDIQGTIYRELEAIMSGGERIPFIIAGADKKKSPSLELIGFSKQDHQIVLNEVGRNMPRILEVKAGKVEPTRCEKCDFCKHTKVLTGTIDHKELIEG